MSFSSDRLVHIGLAGCDCAELILSVTASKGRPPVEHKHGVDTEHSTVSPADLGLSAWDPARVSIKRCTPCPKRHPDWLK